MPSPTVWGAFAWSHQRGTDKAVLAFLLYPQNFHFYSFPVTMWACLRLARPLIMMIVVQCRAEVLSAGWKRPQLLFRCTLVAAVAALYVWFFVQLSVSVTRFLMLFVVYVDLLWWGAWSKL